jgi:hypothetical protein
MTAPAAVLVHHIAGRTRFRIPAKRGDDAYFATIGEQFSQCPGVSSVATNSVTGSVLIAHESSDPGVLLAYARTFELFEAAETPSGAPQEVRAPAAIVTEGLRKWDDWVRAETRDATDLRSVALIGLVAAAVWQMARGSMLPAAGTLIWYALWVARASGQSTASPDAVKVPAAPGQVDYADAE